MLSDFLLDIIPIDGQFYVGNFKAPVERDLLCLACNEYSYLHLVMRFLNLSASLSIS